MRDSCDKSSTGKFPRTKWKSFLWYEMLASCGGAACISRPRTPTLLHYQLFLRRKYKLKPYCWRRHRSREPRPREPAKRFRNRETARLPWIRGIVAWCFFFTHGDIEYRIAFKISLRRARHLPTNFYYLRSHRRQFFFIFRHLV
jgi:hypothetical protein